MSGRSKGFMASNISKIRSEGGVNKGFHGRKKKPYQDERLDIVKIRAEIRDLAGTTLEGKNKNKWKSDKLTALGAAPDKSIRTPYKILMGMKKAEKHREEIRNRRMQEALGFDVAKHVKKRKEEVNKQRDFVNQLRGNRRGDRNTVGDGSFGFQTPIGRTSGSLLTLSNRDIASVEQRNKNNNRPLHGGVTKKKGTGFNRKGGYGEKSKARMRKKK